MKKLTTEKIASDIVLYDEDAPGDVVAYIPIASKNAKKHAAEIVTAVNSQPALVEALETQTKAVEIMFRDWNMARTTRVQAGQDEDVYRNGLDMYRALENLDLANRTARAALQAKG